MNATRQACIFNLIRQQRVHSQEQLRELLLEAGWEGRLDALRSSPDAPGLLDAMAERLTATLQGAGLRPEVCGLKLGAYDEAAAARTPASRAARRTA